MVGEQRIRAFLFYLSVTVFFAGLPSILSFALGYKFNPHTFKFTKTGIISLKTQPEGASVYLNGGLLDVKTPATIGELLPGSYSIKLELKQHYPWLSQVNVEPRKVSRLEKIILFPNRMHITQLNQERVSFFWPDQDNKRIYYLNQGENILYRSNLEGERFEEVGSLPERFLSPPRELKISPDKGKMLIYNAHQISVLYLTAQGDLSYARPSVILDYPQRQIKDVFWHSKSYYLIVVTDMDIEVLEIEAKPNPINLVNLNKRSHSVFYDINDDTLYFMDSQKGADGISYDNVYKLELNSKAYLSQDPIGLRQNARE